MTGYLAGLLGAGHALTKARLCGTSRALLRPGCEVDTQSAPDKTVDRQLVNVEGVIAELCTKNHRALRPEKPVYSDQRPTVLGL